MMQAYLAEVLGGRREARAHRMDSSRVRRAISGILHMGKELLARRRR